MLLLFVSLMKPYSFKESDNLSVLACFKDAQASRFFQTTLFITVSAKSDHQNPVSPWNILGTKVLDFAVFCCCAECVSSR